MTGLTHLSCERVFDAARGRVQPPAHPELRYVQLLQRGESLKNACFTDEMTRLLVVRRITRNTFSLAQSYRKFYPTESTQSIVERNMKTQGCWLLALYKPAFRLLSDVP